MPDERWPLTCFRTVLVESTGPRCTPESKEAEWQKGVPTRDLGSMAGVAGYHCGAGKATAKAIQDRKRHLSKEQEDSPEGVFCPQR